MVPLDVRVSTAGPATVLKIVGDAGIGIDPLNRELLRLSAQRPKLVIIDCSELGFVSSLAMGALVAFRRGIHGQQGQLYLAAVQPLVLEAFRRARLQDVFSIQESVDACLVCAPKSA